MRDGASDPCAAVDRLAPPRRDRRADAMIARCAAIRVIAVSGSEKKPLGVPQL